jgi:hypothetical protein
MEAKGKIGQRVQGKSILSNMTYGYVKYIIPPESGQRGYCYAVEFDDGSQLELPEAKIWFTDQFRVAEIDDGVIPDGPVLSDETLLNDDLIIDADMAMDIADDQLIHRGYAQSVRQPAMLKKAKRRPQPLNANPGRLKKARTSNATTILTTKTNIETTNSHNHYQIGNILWKKKKIIDSNIEIVPKYRGNPSIHRPKILSELAINGVMDPFHYFRLMFPWDYWKVIMKATSDQYSDIDGPPPTQGRIITYFGIILSMILNPIRGSRNSYWSTEPEEESVRNPECYGQRFNVTRDEFNTFVSKFRLASYEDATKEQVYYSKYI